MGYNVLSGSITSYGSIQITGSFKAMGTGDQGFVGDGSLLTGLPHTEVYSITNASTDRLITTNDGSGNSFNAEDGLTYSSATRTLTVKGLDDVHDTTITVDITGSNKSQLLHVRSNANSNILFVTGSGKVGVGTGTPIATLDVAGKIAISAESNTPAQPADGKGFLYSKSDGKLYWRSYDVTEVDLTSGTTPTFKTLAVSGQDDVVADSTTDTLTLVAGSNMTITTDAAGDSITFTSTGGGGGGGSGIFTEVDGSNAYVTSSLKLGGTGATSHQLAVVGSTLLLGGMVHKRVSKTADYTITTGDYYIGVDTTGGTFTLTLPVANNTAEGQTFIVKDEGGASNTNAVVIHTSGDADKIDGGDSVVLESPYAAIAIYSDGTSRYYVY